LSIPDTTYTTGNNIDKKLKDEKSKTVIKAVKRPYAPLSLKKKSECQRMGANGRK
jgi:hypothetical protein